MTALLNELMPTQVPKAYEPTFYRQLINLLNRGLVRDFKPLLKPQTINSASADIDVTTEIAYVDYTATGASAVNLPDAELMKDRRLTVKDRGLNSAANNITIARAGSNLIDNATTYVINVNGRAVDLVSDGSNWNLISIYP